MNVITIHNLIQNLHLKPENLNLTSNELKSTQLKRVTIKHVLHYRISSSHRALSKGSGPLALMRAST